MKTIVYMLLAMAIIFAAIAQTTVTYNADLYSVGTVYTNRVVDSASFDPGASGAGFWDFTIYGTGAESDFISVAYDTGIPHIADCAEMPNYILYYNNVTDTSDTEGWGFSKVDSPYVYGLGLYGTLESDGSTYELATFNDTYTHSQEFPINMSDSWTEATSGGGFVVAYGFTIDYDIQDTNWYNVDGYGQIVLPSGAFDALRITKRHWQHSYSSHILFGFDKTVRSFSYIWACTELGFAVTFEGPTDSTGGMPDSTFTSGKLTMQISNSSLEVAENPATPGDFKISAYPNPFNGNCRIMLNDLGLGIDAIEVFDVNGRIITTLRPSATPLNKGGTENAPLTKRSQGVSYIWTPDPSIGSGVYLVRAKIEGNSVAKRVIYLK